MLDRFAADMNKLAQGGGLTLTDKTISKALMVFAMQMYYENPNATDADKKLFSDVSGGIRFNREDVAASLSEAQGYGRYFLTYLQENFTGGELEKIMQELPSIKDWYIQAGGVSMGATGGSERAFMLGGTGQDNLSGGSGADLIVGGKGADTLNGSEGNDILIGGESDDTLIGGSGTDTILGGAGADILEGGTGADRLEGGLGSDTYVYRAGGGADVIRDIDGLGSIKWTGADGVERTLSGGQKVAPTVWRSDDDQFDYWFQDRPDGSKNLVIGNGADRLIIEQWQDGALGIALENAPTTPDDRAIIRGDQYDAYFRITVPYEDRLATRRWGLPSSIQDERYWIELDFAPYDSAHLVGSVLPSKTGSYWVDRINRDADGKPVSIDFTYTEYDSLGNLKRSGPVPAEELLYGQWGEGLWGSRGDDRIESGTGSDVVLAGQGNDIVVGGTQYASSSYIDLLLGEEGNDTLYADNETDWASLDSPDAYTGGDDRGKYGSYGDWLLGQSGDDQLLGSPRADALLGGAGKDLLLGGDGDDVLAGDQERWHYYLTMNDFTPAGLFSTQYRWRSGGSWKWETVSGTPDGDSDILYGNAGNDRLHGLQGDDFLFGGTGDDTITGDQGNDVIVGGDGNDLLTGEFNGESYGDGSQVEIYGDDYIDGGAGDDTIQGEGGNDYLLGGSGDDQLWGDAHYYGLDPGKQGDDYLDGGDGDDSLDGQGGNDELFGGNGSDILQGGTGNDYLEGEAGNDVLMGGSGSDTYFFGMGHGIDVIEDNAGEGNTLVFGAGVDPASVILNLGSLLIKTGNGEDAIHIQGFDPNDVQAAPVIESFQFADGTMLSYAQLLERGFDIAGTAADDDLTGTNTTDRISGGAGNDTLDGGAGNDTLVGDAGNDTLQGGLGDDRYVFHLGDGEDTVVDTHGSDTLYIGSDLTLADIKVVNDNGNVVVSIIGMSDSVVLSNWFGQTEGVNHIQFCDGTVLDRAGIASMTSSGVNHAPVNATAIADQQTDEDAPFSFTVPANTFTDVDNGDTLTYSATLADGTELPGWLIFDAATQTFGGTPLSEDVGNLDVRVTATDTGGLSASGAFVLNVINVNDTPTANADTGAATEDGGAVQLDAIALMANDSDLDFIHGDALNIIGVSQADSGAAVSLANGVVQYDIGTLFQSLAQGQTMTDTFDYTVSDTAGATSTTQVTMTVTGVNDVPVTAGDTATVQEDIASATGNVLSNDTDIDQGTVLSVADAGLRAGSYGSLTLATDGSYTYNVDNTSVAVQSLGRTAQVSEQFDYAAMDGIVGVSSALDVTLNGTNDAPILVAPFADQDFTFHKPFSWQMPSGSFTDIDQGDTLDYSATLADGSALPDWLKFDAATQTFSGVAPKKVGYVDINVTATDKVAATGSTAGSLSASDTFRISISHGNEGLGNGQDAPPPGHCGNQNDGPGASPGYPGSQGGRDDEGPSKHGKGKSCDDAHDERSDGEDRNKLSNITYLDPKQLDKHYDDFAGTREETDTGATLARWIEVDLAVSRQMAMEDKSLPWLHQKHGADIAALHQASAGFLGSKHGFGADPLSLATSAPLKTFRGLREGMERIG